MEPIYCTDEFYATTRQTWNMIDTYNYFKEDGDQEFLKEELQEISETFKRWIDTLNKQRAFFENINGGPLPVTDDEDNFRTMIQKIIETIDGLE